MNPSYLGVCITVGIALAGGIWALIFLAFRAGSEFAEVKHDVKFLVSELTKARAEAEETEDKVVDLDKRDARRESEVRQIDKRVDDLARISQAPRARG